MRKLPGHATGVARSKVIDFPAPKLPAVDLQERFNELTRAFETTRRRLTITHHERWEIAGRLLWIAVEARLLALERRVNAKLDTKVGL
jgi:hypothetical protein